MGIFQISLNIKEYHNIITLYNAGTTQAITQSADSLANTQAPNVTTPTGTISLSYYVELGIFLCSDYNNMCGVWVACLPHYLDLSSPLYYYCVTNIIITFYIALS